MSAHYRMHIMALVQQNDSNLFRKIHHEYARQHSKSVAQYMVDNLEYWHDGRKVAQSRTLQRLESFAFPDVSDSEKRPLIEALYEEYRSRHSETDAIDFRIGHNIEESTSYLNRIVEGFASDDYDLDLSCDFSDGIAWICQDDIATAHSILRRHTQPIGKRNYTATRPAVDEFLSRLQNGELPIPFEQRFELVHGYITVDYKHRLRKRIGDSMKKLGTKLLFWK